MVGAIAPRRPTPATRPSLPVLVVLSILGFIGSVSVARFVRREQHDDPQTVADCLAGACLIAGALLSLAAGIGAAAFPGPALPHARGHQAAGARAAAHPRRHALRLRNTIDITTLVLVGVFQLATAPVAAHMVGRAVYRAGQVARTCWWSTNWPRTARTGDRDHGDRSAALVPEGRWVPPAKYAVRVGARLVAGREVSARGSLRRCRRCLRTGDDQQVPSTPRVTSSVTSFKTRWIPA